MNLLKILASVAGLFFSSVSFASPPEVPLGWGYEFGFNGARSGSGLRFLLESQSIYLSQHKTEPRKDSYSFTFGSDSLTVGSERLEMASGGLRIRRIVDGYQNVSYLDVNALYAFTNSDKSYLATNDPAWGARVSFGFDLPYAEYDRIISQTGKVYGYFFVEGGWLIGFPNVAGQGDLLNGVTLTLGFKARYL